jgi:hypothetical protein
MNIQSAVESLARVENAGGLFYLSFPYRSSVGNADEALVVKVPIKSATPTASDNQALVETVKLQGGLGTWVQKEDGTVCLLPNS